MKKSTWITWTLTLLIIVLAIFIKTAPNNSVPEEVARCIGEKATVYSQIGCHFCEIQKDKFGDNYIFLDEFLCNADNWETCKNINITGTPTWIIKDTNQRLSGVQEVETLRELTGC